MHARRTESTEASFRDPQVFKRVIIKTFKASSSTSGVFAGLLRIAQCTGSSPSMNGSCRTAERSRPQSLQAWMHCEKTEVRSSSEVSPRKSKDSMEVRTNSLACACAPARRAASSSLSLAACSAACLAASSSSIRALVPSVTFRAVWFVICAVALRADLFSLRIESGLKAERDLTTGALGGARDSCDEEPCECGDSEGVRSELGRGVARDD